MITVALALIVLLGCFYTWFDALEGGSPDA